MCVVFMQFTIECIIVYDYFLFFSTQSEESIELRTRCELLRKEIDKQKLRYMNGQLMFSSIYRNLGNFNSQNIHKTFFLSILYLFNCTVTAHFVNLISVNV